MADISGILIQMFEEQAALLLKHASIIRGDTKFAPTASDQIEEIAKKGKKKRDPVDPNKPKKPPSAYILYFGENHAACKLANPSFSQSEIMAALGNSWSAMPMESKEKFVKQAEIQKELYGLKMTVYSAGVTTSSSSLVPPRKSPIKADNLAVTPMKLASVNQSPAKIIPESILEIPTPIIVTSVIAAPVESVVVTEKELRKRKKRALREAEAAALAAAAEPATPVHAALSVPQTQEIQAPETEKKKVTTGSSLLCGVRNKLKCEKSVTMHNCI